MEKINRRPLSKPVVMWKVLEAALGKRGAQTQCQLVADELGLLCTKPSPVPFCAPALLHVSAREY